MPTKRKIATAMYHHYFAALNQRPFNDVIELRGRRIESNALPGWTRPFVVVIDQNGKIITGYTTNVDRNP
ncbi:MAG: hypothetical protein ACREXY_06670 [Gammaproteobacteria bacterium]